MNPIQQALEEKLAREQAAPPAETPAPPAPENNLEKKVDQWAGSVAQLASTTSQLVLQKQTEAAIFPPAAAKEDPIPSFEEDPEKAMEKIAERTAERVANRTIETLNKKTEQQNWDARAESDFPDLKDKSSDFYRDVFNDYHAAENVGEKASPKAVYNAACRVAARRASEGKSIGRSLVRDESARHASLAGSTPTYRQPGSGGEPPALSAEEKYIADKLRVPHDKYRQLRRVA